MCEKHCRRHQGRRATEEIGDLNRLVDLRFRGTGSTGTVGNRRTPLRVSHDRIDNHGHEDFVLGGNGAILQHVLALRQVHLGKLRIALLQLVYPLRQCHLCHRFLLARAENSRVILRQ